MKLFKIVANIKIRMLAIFLILFSGSVSAENGKQRIAQFDGEITVGADGAVNAVSLKKVHDAKLEKFFIERIKTWEFYPVTINGKPIEATTNFSFDLLATYDAGKTLKQIEFTNILIMPSNIEVEIKNKSGFKTGKLGQVNYPIEALRSGAEANVILAIELTSEGKVKNADVSSIELINIDVRESKKFAKYFGSSALNGARQHEYSKDELVEYQCINGCISTWTVYFTMGRTSAWKSYQPLPIAPIPWVIASELKDMNELEKSQLVRLKVDPTGKSIDMDS